MTRKIWTSLILGLSVVVAVPGFAQQRAGRTTNRQPAKTSSAATTNASSAANSAAATKAAPAGSEQDEARPAPNMQGGPRERGAEGERRAPRMGGFALIGVQMRAYQEAKGESDKVSIDAFLTSFMKAAKAADADSDGKLSQEELQKLQESSRPNFGGSNGDAEGRRGPRGGNGAEQGAPANGRRSRQNSTSYNESTTDVVVRAQEDDGEFPQGGPQGFPGRPGEGGPQSFPGQPGEGGPQGFPGQPGEGGPQGFPGQPGEGGPQGFPGQPGQDGAQRPESGMMKAMNEATDEEDGSVDLAKLETAVKAALTEADADEDGSLDDAEWRTYSGFGGGMPGGFGGGMPGGADMGRRMRAMGVSMLQRQVQEKAQTEDGKIDVAKFRSEYLSLLNDADSDGDGVLSEEELQALQEKAAEEMRANEEARRGQRGGFGGPGGGSPFDAMKNEDGKIDLSKLPESPFSQGMKAADKDNDGFLDEDELKALQEQMRSMMRQGGPQGGPNGDADGGRPGRRGGNDAENGDRRPQRGGFGVLENQNVIVRAQEQEDAEQGRQGRQRGGMPGGFPGQGEPGMQGGPNGMPGGFGGMRGGMPGMGMGFGMPRGNSSAVQKAISKATQEDGTFVIKTFDEELAKALENADNEDDGLLDQIEQEDAFGMAIMRRPGAGPNQGDEQRGPRAGRDDAQGRPEGRPGANEQQGRRPNGPNDQQGRQRQNDRQMNDRFQAMRVPTPDDSFVGVNANPDFKFGKARKEGDSAEKSPIEADYAIGKYEVRNREYKEFVDATKREALPKYWVDGTYVKGTKNCPVVGITLKDAQDYCDWLTSQNEDGWTFRLPTEAEFENAAAGTKKQRFPWGTTSNVSYTKGVLTTNCLYNGAVIADLIEQDVTLTIGGKKQKVADVAKLTTKGVVGDEGWRDSAKKAGFTYSDVFASKVKQGGFAVPVNKYRENESPYGCVGMAGNASEWTTSVVDGKNVVRGGSWYSSIDECAATWRGELKDPAKGDPTVGFRVVAEKN